MRNELLQEEVKELFMICTHRDRFSCAAKKNDDDDDERMGTFLIY